MTAILLVLIIINIAVIIASVAIGSVKLTPKEVITGLFGSNESEGINAIVSSVRLPRMLGSVLAGIALSVSGLLLQTVTDNKLSAPNIIGVNSGAGFAVMLALALIPTLSRFIISFSVINKSICLLNSSLPTYDSYFIVSLQSGIYHFSSHPSAKSVASPDKKAE